MISVFDQLGHEINFREVPKRIVSIVPSQTELLFDLGLEEEVVGITKFCIHPDRWFRNKERIGGTKQVNIEAVKALRPDLIIGNKEENTQEDILALQKIAPVWLSDIYTLDDALAMIQKLGDLCGKGSMAAALSSEIISKFDSLNDYLKKNSSGSKKVLYLIWNEPLMAAGGHTFIDDMLTKCGLKNVVSETRYPIIKEQLFNPEFVLLSSEPFHFNNDHLQQIQSAFPNAIIIRVDGEAFSWYGSRLKSSPLYFRELISDYFIN